MPFTIEGLVAATFTPMKENGDVDLEAIDSYQKYLIDQGIRHAYVNGSTGEVTSLTCQERKSITAKWKELSRLPGREMKVLVQIGGSNFRETLELTRHAASVGVDGISTLPPLYFLPTSVDELVDYCRRIGEQAPKVPLYYYHIPQRSGVTFDMVEFLEKSRRAVPSLRGIKFTSKDLYEGAQCLRVVDAQGDRYDLLYGQDEQALAAFAMGFKGAIGTLYSVMASTYHRLIQAVQEGKLDEARELQYRSVDLIKALSDTGSRTGGFVPAMKAVLAECGVKAGPPRYPMQPLDDKVRTKLIGQLKAIGFFDWLTQKQ